MNQSKIKIIQTRFIKSKTEKHIFKWKIVDLGIKKQLTIAFYQQDLWNMAGIKKPQPSSELTKQQKIKFINVNENIIQKFANDLVGKQILWNYQAGVSLQKLKDISQQNAQSNMNYIDTFPIQQIIEDQKNE